MGRRKGTKRRGCAGLWVNKGNGTCIPNYNHRQISRHGQTSLMPALFTDGQTDPNSHPLPPPPSPRGSTPFPLRLKLSPLPPRPSLSR
ncbi:hypothetical protein BaRGS_00038992 [Batillaria attramentaria]|uniref:Uncharacterized protein n=1 Tax=Batillaria attramentaria TaxID=370345 RepID=A0ABD0J577_9CAEN